MPKQTESTLYFTIGRSRRRKQMMACLHALSLAACWLNDLPAVYRLNLSLLVAVSWFVQLKARKARCIVLRYTLAEGWAVSFDGEEYLFIQIMPTTVTGGMLTVLHYSIDKRTQALVIFKDAMSANDYRKLIVNLKISGCGQG